MVGEETWLPHRKWPKAEMRGVIKFLHVKGKPTKCLDKILSDHGQISAC